MSVEIRHVVTGDCDCGTPRFSWEQSKDHGHHWECDYGVIPSFNLDDPASLAIADQEWVHRALALANGQLHIGEALHTIRIVEDSEMRLFHRIEHRGRSWIWELEPAHWADPPTRHNNAHRAIYLGRWPD